MEKDDQLSATTKARKLLDQLIIYLWLAYSLLTYMRRWVDAVECDHHVVLCAAGSIIHCLVNPPITYLTPSCLALLYLF
jgi:hypothetical protein